MRQDPFDMPISPRPLSWSASIPNLGGERSKEVRNAPEKLVFHRIRRIIPPTLITSEPCARSAPSATNTRTSSSSRSYGNGGAGVFRLKHDDENFGR